MAFTNFKLRIHRTVIVLICLALIVVLMQGAAYFSLNHRVARSVQVEELAKTLCQQVAFSLRPLMENNNEDNTAKIHQTLQNLTQHSRILDASVYLTNGSLLTKAGEEVSTRERLALDDTKASNHFTHQLVEPISGKNGPLGFLRLTLDTHILVTETQQVDNTTNVLRLMILLALVIGIVLAHTLLYRQRSRWQQSPYLLTANAGLPPDAHSDKSADIKPEAQTEDMTQTVVITEAETKAELKARKKAEAEAKAEIKAKEKAEAKARAEIKAKEKAEAKARAEIKAKEKAEAKAKAQAEAKARADIKAEAAAKTKAKNNAEIKAKAYVKAKADAKVKAELKPDTKTDSEEKKPDTLRELRQASLRSQKSQNASNQNLLRHHLVNPDDDDEEN